MNFYKLGKAETDGLIRHNQVLVCEGKTTTQTALWVKYQAEGLIISSWTHVLPNSVCFKPHHVLFFVWSSQSWFIVSFAKATQTCNYRIAEHMINSVKTVKQHNMLKTQKLN